MTDTLNVRAGRATMAGAIKAVLEEAKTLEEISGITLALADGLLSSCWCLAGEDMSQTLSNVSQLINDSSEALRNKQ